MALYRVRVVLDQSTRLPADRVVWSWGVDGPAPIASTAEDLYDAWYAAVGFFGSSSNLGYYLPTGLAFRALEMYPAAGGEAVAVYEDDTNLAHGSATPLPPQCAQVVSCQIDSLRGVRPKGRYFLGPLSTRGNSSGRPSTNLTNAALGFATSWHNGLLANGYTPVVLGADGTVSRGAIVGYVCSNSFDTMRSRGLERTALTSATP